ncbi:MAG: AlbA family DNA-binding domain-containing protein [Actinomycetota bacterium]
MPVVEPVVTEEKLSQLLDEQHESEALDYKSACDLSERRDIVEIAKDVGAMQVRGGFIVVGADDRGTLTGDLTQETARLMDEATLRAKLDRYIPEPYDIRTAVHSVEGSLVGVVYVGPNAKGWCIFKRDGTYEGPDGRSVTVFRAGEVFTRHGSASERWRQDDIEMIIARLVDQQRESWRRGLAEDFQHMAASSRAQGLAGGPAASFTWKVDAESFIDTAVEQLRRGDDIPLRFLLSSVGADAAALLATDGGEQELGVLLDRLTCLAATMLILGRSELFEEGVAGVVTIYDQGFGPEGLPKRDTPVPPQRLWLMVVERVVALGGLAVRRENWEAVRHLALRRGHGRDFDSDGYEYTSWLRHAVTMASRSNLLKEQQGDRFVELSLLSLALEHVRRNDCLHPDLAEDDERVLDSLCQFDALAALVAIGEAQSAHARILYTSFARFYSHRTEPAIIRVIEDPVARSILYPHDDKNLAGALRALNQWASQEGWRFSGWDGFLCDRVRTFLNEHPAEEAGGQS